MSSRLPSLPVDNRTILFRRAEEILRAAPALAVVKSWNVGDGSGLDIAKVSSGLLPWVRMVPTSIPMGQVALQTRQHNFGIYIEVITPGTSYDDFMNFWGAVESAFVKSRDLGPAFNGKSVFDFLRCGRAATDPRPGLIDLFVEQDTVGRFAADKDQIIGRYGSGLVMFPFTKQS